MTSYSSGLGLESLGPPPFKWILCKLLSCLALSHAVGTNSSLNFEWTLYLWAVKIMGKRKWKKGSGQWHMGILPKVWWWDFCLILPFIFRILWCSIGFKILLLLDSIFEFVRSLKYCRIVLSFGSCERIKGNETFSEKQCVWGFCLFFRILLVWEREGDRAWPG